jgi:hypothetical protein
MKKQVLEILLRISAALRRKRMAILLEHFQFDADTKVLDVGGSGDWDWKEAGVEASITVINLYPPEEVGTPNYIQGDACDMHMFKDNEFDLVISNSVIEHLPSHAHQCRMASEIQRVGRSYWVQTPNRHFPLELHLCFPFVQYLPVPWRIAFARVWPFSFEKMRGRSAENDAQVILLTKRQFQGLFPGSDLVCEKFAGLTKSLIAVRGSNA